MDARLLTRSDKAALGEPELREIALHRDHAQPAVSRLPAEILSAIFCLVRDAAWQKLRNRANVRDADWQDFEPEYRDYYGVEFYWKNPSQVCQHWRSVAIACQSLWSGIDMTNPSAAEENLRLSRSVPLDIIDGFSFTSHRRSDREAWSKVMDHVARFRNIGLYCVDDTPLHALASDLHIAAVNLKTLNIYSTRVTEASNSFLTRSMPSLTHLYLCNIVPPYPLPTFPTSLVVLSLILTIEPSNSPFSVGHVLNALSTTPNLEDLCLSRIVAEPSSPDTLDALGSANLPNLKRLTFTTSEFGGFIIFKCLNYPGTAAVDVWGYRLYVSQNGSVGLQHLCYRPEAPLARKLQIKFNHEELCAKAYDERGRVYLQFNFFSPWDDAFDQPPAEFTPPLAFRTICSALPMTHLRCLEISNDYDAMDWENILRSMVLVEELKVVTQDQSSLIRLLEVATGNGYLPVLRRLDFSGSVIDDPLGCYDKGMDPLPALDNFFNQHQESGKPIEQLVLTQCRIFRSTLDELKNMVCVVMDPEDCVDDDDADDDDDEGFESFDGEGDEEDEESL